MRTTTSQFSLGSCALQVKTSPFYVNNPRVPRNLKKPAAKHSDQPVHLHRLIQVFAACMLYSPFSSCCDANKQ